MLFTRLVVLGWVVAGAAAAVEVPDLFNPEISVASRDEKNRPADLQRAMHRVLGRIVKPDALAAAKALESDPERFVLRYEYAKESQQGVPGPVMRVEFDGQELRDALRARGHETFGPQRPEALLWLAIADEQGERLFDPDKAAELEAALLDLSDETGVPLATINNDPTDLEFIKPADLPRAAPERLRSASARYDSDVILAGRVTHTATTPWKADWRLLAGELDESWKAEAPEVVGVLQSALQGTYARLASRLVPPSGAAAQLEVRIDGILSLDDSNRAGDYLRGLSPVTKVEWVGLDGQTTVFKASVRGGRPWLDRSVALGRRLLPATDGAGSGARYRWQP